MRFFDELQLYSECFAADRTEKAVYKLDLSEQPFYDGKSRRIRLRDCCIDKAVKFVREKADKGDIYALQMLDNVFQPILEGREGFSLRFVLTTDTNDFISVITLVRPWDRAKFLVHLCLSLGTYDTETDLFCVGDLKESFRRAGLITSTDIITQDDILNIVREYVTNDLIFHPISARQFCKYLKSAIETLEDFFWNGTLGDYSPCLSDVALKDQASDEIKLLETTRKDNLVHGLMDDDAIAGMLPPNVGTATFDSPVVWNPQIVPAEGMTAEAVAEQSAALLCCTRAIDKFMDPRCRGMKFPCLVGRAGSVTCFIFKR